MWGPLKVVLTEQHPLQACCVVVVLGVLCPDCRIELLSGNHPSPFSALLSAPLLPVLPLVCWRTHTYLHRYEEVELLVEGLPHLDFKELQAGARYEAGYSATHPTIVALW